MKIIRKGTTISDTRFSAQLEGVAIGCNSIRLYTQNNGQYPPETIKANNNSGCYGFVVVELSTEVADQTFLCLKGSVWIFTGGIARGVGSSGGLAGVWTMNGHHRDTHTTNKMNGSLFGGAHSDYWGNYGPFYNSRCIPLFYHNATDSKIACWFGTFDQWRNNGEAATGQVWEGNVHVGTGINTEQGDTAKAFITDAYTSYNLPGTNNAWSYWTVDDFSVSTSGAFG